MFKISMKIYSVCPDFAGKAFRVFFSEELCRMFFNTMKENTILQFPYDLMAVLPPES